jgi:tetratricopeptide (TPR) repeat protein/tRNA A-37 threonylcarbamoyl transferase component Bud32
MPPTLGKSLSATTAPASPEMRAVVNPPSASAGPRYRTLRPLGKGGLGEVFVALDEEVNREVALKEIQPTHAGSGDSVARFLLEAEVTGRLEHPGVVPVYGLGRHADGRPYYAMRLIKGETLQDALARFHQADAPGRELGERRLAFRDLLRRFTDVCNAVAYAHSKGVLHRDLKPSNIMLGPFGETLVVDWGLTKVLGTSEAAVAASGVLLPGTSASSTQAGAVVGTPAYMSPEQAAGHNLELTAATDVYSLGAILYALLTGRGPFSAAANVYTVLGQVRKGHFAPPRALKRSVPPALEAVCLKAMALTPEARYASAKDLAADVEHWLGDEPVTAYREPLPARLRRWGRRHRSFVSALAALVLTLTAALAVGLVLVRAEQAKTERALAEKNVEATKAREAAERAEKAEREGRIELGRTSAAAARLSAQRGQWEDALRHYRQALTLEPEDDVALRLGMLECHLARYEFRAFRDELARLAARTDLGTHRGEVRLQQALEEMYSTRKDADPPALVRQALDLGLPPVEEAFARALIAPTLPEVVENLQHAARLAPFHRRAHEILPAGLFLLGRIPEMRAAVARLHLIAPNATSAGMWQGYIHVLDGNLEAAYRECERLRPNVGEDGVVVLKMMMRALHAMSRSEMAWETEAKRQAILADVLGAAPQLSQLFQDSSNPKKAERWADFAMYRLPCFRPLADHPLFKNSGNIGQLMALLQPKAMNELAVRLVDTCPNGMFIYMQSTWLYAEGRLAEAEAALGRAVRTPSPFPVRRVALADLTTLQFRRLAKEPPESQPQFKEMIRANLRDLAGQGTYPAHVSRHLANIARGVGENALALTFSEAAVRSAKGDRTALNDRLLSETAFDSLAQAIATLNEMVAKTPDDAALVNQRAVVEYRHGYFANATASCFAALRADPKQPNAAGNLATIEMEVRRRMAIYSVLLEKLRLRPALILAHQGRHAEAVKAVAAEKAEGDTAAALACLYAVASSAAAADSTLSPEERGKRAEEYAVKAIDLLRRGQAAGYFKGPPRANYLLKVEHDFDVLRQREDFKKVIAAIKQ